MIWVFFLSFSLSVECFWAGPGGFPFLDRFLVGVLCDALGLVLCFLACVVSFRGPVLLLSIFFESPLWLLFF